MANHQIPRTAEPVEQVNGLDADGNVVTVIVYEHTRQGRTRPEWIVLHYREHNRAMDRSSRQTRQFSGATARQRLDRELAETRNLLGMSKEARHAELFGTTA